MIFSEKADKLTDKKLEFSKRIGTILEEKNLTLEEKRVYGTLLLGCKENGELTIDFETIENLRHLPTQEIKEIVLNLEKENLIKISDIPGNNEKRHFKILDFN